MLFFGVVFFGFFFNVVIFNTTYSVFTLTQGVWLLGFFVCFFFLTRLLPHYSADR